MNEVFEAIEQGDVQRLRALVEGNPSVVSARDQHGRSPVLGAQYRWRQDMVDVLLGARPELDVFEAAAVGDATRVRELVVREPSLVDAVSVDGFTPLQVASYFGRIEAVRVLLEYGADVHAVSQNSMRVQPLHAACASGQGEIARLLLDAGADVNAGQNADYTPLHEAAGNGDEQLVRLLLERGADRRARLDDGKTPRELALEKGHEALAALLGA